MLTDTDMCLAPLSPPNLRALADHPWHRLGVPPGMVRGAASAKIPCPCGLPKDFEAFAQDPKAGTQTTVYLRPTHFKGGPLGEETVQALIGQCERCGKVYYATDECVPEENPF